MVSTSVTQPGLAPDGDVPLHETQSGEVKTAGVLAGRARLVAYSIADQAFAVGGMFLANVALARVRSKEEYGAFALCYSVYTFLAGLHNAIILEPFTVFGSGRYHQKFQSYARLMRRRNAALCAGLSILLLFVWSMLRWIAPQFALPVFLGMALTSGVLMTGTFIRRAFYIERRPDLAAGFSISFVIALGLLLALTIRNHWLTGFTTFTIAALGWFAAALVMRRVIPGRNAPLDFHKIETGYWSEHWKYSRWVLATAFVFQLMTQGYYWLVAGFLSVKDLAGLRAMHLLVTPVDQLFIAFTLLILPMMAHRYATGQPGALISLWAKYSLLFLAITTAFALAVRAVSLPLLHVTYGGKFDELSHLLALLVFVPLIMGVGNATNAALKAIERPSAVFYAYVASGLVTFLAGAPLVIRYGLRGAVYGMLLSAAAYTVTLVVLWLIFLLRRRGTLSANVRSRLRIAIVEPVWTHYRHPVYRELAEYCDVDWIFSPADRAVGFGPRLPAGNPSLRYLEVPRQKPFGDKVGFWQCGLVRYMVLEAPDVVMASADPDFLSFWTTLVVGRVLGIPVYSHGHGVYKKERIPWAYRRMMGLLLRLSTGYIAYAPMVRDAFGAHGFSTEKVHVAHNSLVNPCPLSPEEKTGKERGIIFLGRLRPLSGIETLLRAVQRVREQEKLDCELHVVGDGEQGDRLRKEYATADWVHWHGEVYDPAQICEIAQDCFVGCYPGDAGLSIVQMMSLSLPVVLHGDLKTSHGPEASFIADGENGLLFDRSAPEEGIHRCLNALATDHARLRRMQYAAAQTYQALTTPSLACRLWEILGNSRIQPVVTPRIVCQAAE